MKSKKQEKIKQRLNVNVNPDVEARIKFIAKELKLSTSSVVNFFVKRYVIPIADTK